MTAADRDRVTNAVAEVWRRLGVSPDPARRGPVLLAPLTDEQSELRRVTLPKLTCTAVYDHLVATGMTPADVGDMDEELAGFLFVTPSVGLMFVNGADPVPRQRFTAAHELGHFVLHRGEMGGRVSFADTPAMVGLSDEQSHRHERQANRFAVELLMPEAVCRARATEFRQTFGILPRGPLAYRLAAELLVSREAMRYRLNELGVGDE